MLRHKAILSAVLVVGILAWAAVAQAEVVIETVTVGNPGNADDTHGDGYGGVDYVYQIGTFEVTAGQYTEFLNAVADDDTYGLYNTNMWSIYGCKIERTGSTGSYSYSVAGDRTDRPVNYVSWSDAARFSNWLHNGQPTGAQGLTTTENGSYFLNGAVSDADLLAVTRELDATWVIPSEDECYKAAYHYNDGVTANYYDYPTSSDTVPSNDLIDPDPGNNASFYESGYTIGSPYFRTVAGDFENSKSPYNTFDQGGNAWEWNEAVIGSFRGLRGGSFGDDRYYLRAATRIIYSSTPENIEIGFRVAMFADCNDNDVPDECDLDCGATFGPSGELCSVVYPAPACGQSGDDNADGIPDDCGACWGPLECFQVAEAACDSLGEYEGDGTTCEAAECNFIPAVSTWGLLILAILLVNVATIFIRGRSAMARSI